jgi:hypothetical protein
MVGDARRIAERVTRIFRKVRKIEYFSVISG